MKISCFNTIFYVITLLFTCINVKKGTAQTDTLFISNDFEKANLAEVARIYSSNEKEEILELYASKSKLIENKSDQFYFGFKKESNYIVFTVKNSDRSFRKLIMEFSNSHIDQIKTYKKRSDTFSLINTTGVRHPFRSRLLDHRNFLIPIELAKNESQTYIIEIGKEIGRPLVTSIEIFDEVIFDKRSVKQYLIIGLYFGLSVLSILLSLFAFYFLRNYGYLIYAIYVMFLGLFICSYLGLYQQIFLSAEVLFNKYLHYVLFSEVSFLLFIIFSQKVLNVKESFPKLNKVVKVFVIALVVIRFSIHFVFPELFLDFISVFMKMWYGIILLVCLLIFYEIVALYKKNKKRTTLFAIAYLFMITGAIVTVLYHSTGVVDATFYGLPVIFYSSLFEILFLTFTIVFMVKQIYDERNVLSNQLAHQQQKFLTAFIDGQEKERERIGKELHDNVGSKLSNFKRIFFKNFSDKKMIDEIDVLCNDVRDLSHQISPPEIKLVGLPGAITDLVTSHSDERLIIEFNCYEFPENLSETITSNLFRIVQESLHNIVKHAEAKLVDVQLIGHENYLTLTIEDDGKGFNNSKSLKGIGLKNIKSRTQQLNGDFSLNTALNKGTSILITIPI